MKSVGDSLSVAQVAYRLGVSRTRIYFLIKEGRFPSAVRDERYQWAIDSDDLALECNARNLEGVCFVPYDAIPAD